MQRRRRASPLVFNSSLIEERTRWLDFSGQLPDTFSFLVPIKEHIEEWNKLNADPGTRNAEHQIDFLIAWTIDERKDAVAAFCPYVKGVRSISTKPIVLIGRIVVLKNRKISPLPHCNAKCHMYTRPRFILATFEGVGRRNGTLRERFAWRPLILALTPDG